MSSPLRAAEGRLIDLRRQRELYSLQNHGLRRRVPRMAVAECGICENLAKYYGQKSAPARL